MFPERLIVCIFNGSRKVAPEKDRIKLFQAEATVPDTSGFVLAVFFSILVFFVTTTLLAWPVSLMLRPPPEVVAVFLEMVEELIVAWTPSKSRPPPRPSWPPFAAFPEIVLFVMDMVLFLLAIPPPSPWPEVAVTVLREIVLSFKVSEPC